MAQTDTMKKIHGILKEEENVRLTFWKNVLSKMES